MEIAFDVHRLPPPDPHATRRVVGLSLVQAMCALLPDNDPALHEALAESYKRAFQTLRADGHVNEPLFPGIARLLDEIDARGWLMGRSEEHTSELQSLMRISYAVFCLKNT